MKSEFRDSTGGSFERLCRRCTRSCHSIWARNLRWWGNRWVEHAKSAVELLLLFGQQQAGTTTTLGPEAHTCSNPERGYICKPGAVIGLQAPSAQGHRPPTEEGNPNTIQKCCRHLPGLHTDRYHAAAVQVSNNQNLFPKLETQSFFGALELCGGKRVHPT